MIRVLTTRIKRPSRISVWCASDCNRGASELTHISSRSALPCLPWRKRTRTNLFPYGSKTYARLQLLPSQIVNVHRQVRDEKGRRRLHGAFTGGFSAGYFNTVGSKEGASLLLLPILRHTLLTFRRMDPINIRLIEIGACQAEGIPSGRLYGRGGYCGTKREPANVRHKRAATA
jgi:hypothetical protein